MHYVMAALLLASLIVHDGHQHQIYTDEWFGHLQVFDRVDHGPIYHVSQGTEGNAYNPDAAACGGVLMVVYQIDATLTSSDPMLRYGIWDPPFWTSDAIPGAYGFAPELSCLGDTIVLTYHNGFVLRWRTWTAAGGWTEPSSKPPLLRVYVPLAVGP